MTYDEYLQTDHWLNFSHYIKDFWGWRCALCNGTDRIIVHHRNYDHLWHEEVTDVVALCTPCHEKHHDILPPEPDKWLSFILINLGRLKIPEGI